MNRTARLLFTAAFLIVLAVVFFCSCDRIQGPSYELSVDTAPQTTEQLIPTGKLYARCSEPEDNQFSIQFISAVPSAYVDYVGFEANKLYPDNTRGPISSSKIRILHEEITDSDRGITITPKDFGLEEGYLFQRTLERIATNVEDLAYEVAAYYVIGDEKIYTAKQTFYIQELLYEHILSAPKAFEVKEVSPIIDVQKWNKYEMSQENAALIIPEEGVTLSKNYFLGTSSPDAHGNVKMYLCYAIPSDDNTTVGIRYNFTEIVDEGDRLGVKTQTRRVRTNTLYRTVISEKATLTAKDFGLDSAYLAVITMTTDLNTVLYENYDLSIVAYYSSNALEYPVISTTHNFIELVDECVVTYRSIPLATYTYQPLDYSVWQEFSQQNGNAEGNGMFMIRVSKERNERFAMQIASAVPSRYLEKLVFVFSAYDKNGNPIYELDEEQNKIPVENEEIEISTLYPSIFGNTDDITSKDFGFERGHIFTMLLNNIELDGETATVKINAYYRTDYNEQTMEKLPEYTYNTVPLSSLTFSIEDLAELVNSIR